MSRSTGRNLITFGAPGTGKSFSISKLIKKQFDDNHLVIDKDTLKRLPEEVALRTTFHPDSDYSTFVGCYKPQDTDGNGLITYKYQAQTFVSAYLNAWNTQSPYFLIIEEINRGNCAQIFGDIFQLLDRKPSGEHEYDITPDADLARYIKEWFKKNPSDLSIPDEIKEGKKMFLPRNLTILATMNTSDQSLFPMDSAFKRRWEWKYQSIQPGNKERWIEIRKEEVADGENPTEAIRFSWWSFLQKVNERIYSVTKSEDKQLGYWFVKVPANEPISTDLFVSKVIFYLWSDVFKDYGNSNDSPFSVNKETEGSNESNNTEKEHFTFQSFFGKDSEKNLIRFMKGLNLTENVMPDEDMKDPNEPDTDDEDKEGPSAQDKDNNINRPHIIRGIRKRDANNEEKMSDFIANYSSEHPEFKLSLDPEKENFTNCKVKITFFNKKDQTFTGAFTEAADFILTTIGKDSPRLFAEIDAGGAGYPIIVEGTKDELKSRTDYANPTQLKAPLEGYCRLTNKSGNAMVTVFYRMLKLVEKEEQLFTIERVEKN
ncbi:MAG: AAA family ATPase [Bacteroidaceae bacterium]|nr:AAA family ATPase [Bacteroidaceae bacterium]